MRGCWVFSFKLGIYIIFFKFRKYYWRGDERLEELNYEKCWEKLFFGYDMIVIIMNILEMFICLRFVKNKKRRRIGMERVKKKNIISWGLGGVRKIRVCKIKMYFMWI